MKLMPYTRSPFLKWLTFSPTASTVPAPSEPRMIGNLGDMLNSLAKPPSRSKGSQTPTPAASTRTRISFASNSGTGSSRIFISFKPPNRSIATVFIVLFMVRFIERPPIVILTFGKSGGYILEKSYPPFSRLWCSERLTAQFNQESGGAIWGVEIRCASVYRGPVNSRRYDVRCESFLVFQHLSYC